jgi:hypothetical protein
MMSADELAERGAVVRIRSGQRRLIFATAGRIGLRDEQLHDLVESVSDYRTRAIAHLTLREARRLIGILKRMERPPAVAMDAGEGAPGPAAVAPAEAVRRVAAAPAARPRSRRRRAG